MTKETNFTLPSGAPSGGGQKNSLLIGAVIALAAASGYNLYQNNQLKMQIAELRDSVGSEVDKVNETHTTSNKETRASVDKLKTDLDAMRSRAEKLTGDARAEADKKTAALESELQTKMQEQSAQTAKVAERVAQVDTAVAAVKEDTNANREKVGQVDTAVTAVKAQADATNAELKKTIADLSSTKGDLGIQSGLIATNSKELQALRALGERNYVEFTIAKAKTGQRVGDLTVRLTKTDPKKSKYTVEVMANDKLVEKKDKTANEPVQFMMPKYSAPFEFVVNDVKKDVIVGYLSYPKVQVSRN